VRSLTSESQDHPDSLHNRLATRLSHPDPNCCRTEWQLSFHEAFLPDREILLRATDDSMVAFAAFPHPDFGWVLEPLESHWLFGCPLLGEQPAALLRELLQEEPFRGDRPALVVSGVAARSPLARSIVATFGKEYRILLGQPALLRSASLEGGVDGYLSRRSGNHRHKLRQAVKRASALGISFERHRPRGREEVDLLYDRILAVETLSWKGIGACGMAEAPSRDFYRLLLRRWSVSVAGRVVFARREGRDIGFVFGGVNGGHYRGQQFSYAEECRDWSVGNLLQLEQISWLCEEGVSRYDMGPLMEYKVHWAEIEARTETLILLPER
jgi:hypothetical protein